MRKRDMLCAGIVVVLLGFMLASCGTIGNGKIDLPVDVSVAFVQPETGETWSVRQTENGIDVTGQYVDSNGLVWVLGEGVGAISVMDPRTNLLVSIKPKAAE